jgi:hypothetical protein
LIAVMQVYKLLNAEHAIRIKFRPGRHHGFIDVGNYLDWFDAAGSATAIRAAGAGMNGPRLTPSQIDQLFPATSLYHNFSWSEWRSQHPDATTPPPPPPTAPLAERVEWLLGGEGTAYSAGDAGNRVAGHAYCEYGARFRRKVTLVDAIGSHACSLETRRCVTNGTPLRRPLSYLVDTVNRVQTLEGLALLAANGTTRLASLCVCLCLSAFVCISYSVWRTVLSLLLCNSSPFGTSARFGNRRPSRNSGSLCAPLHSREQSADAVPLPQMRDPMHQTSSPLATNASPPTADLTLRQHAHTTDVVSRSDNAGVIDDA